MTIGEIQARIARLIAPRTSAMAGRVRAAYEKGFARGQEIMAPASAALRAWYDRREAREKLLLKVFGAMVAVLFVYAAICAPVVSLRDGLKARAEARRQELVQVRAMMEDWARLEVDLAAAQKLSVLNGKDFSLFSLIQAALTRSVGREKINSITPSDKPVAGGFIQHSIDLKLNDVSLLQIVDTLYNVQTTTVPVTVSKLHIKQREQASHSYDVDLTCSALSKNE